MTDILPYLERIRARFDEPEMQASFRGFARTVQFIFTDLLRNFTLKVAEDGTATLAEQIDPQPAIKVTTTSDTLAAILDRTLNPVHAYVTRKIKAAGKMEDLLKLQKLL